MKRKQTFLHVYVKNKNKHCPLDFFLICDIHNVYLVIYVCVCVFFFQRCIVIVFICLYEIKNSFFLENDAIRNVHHCIVH